jgi:hypothetical protein
MSNPTPPPVSGEADTEIRVMFARFEAKLDVAIAQHGAKLEQHSADIGQLRERVKHVEDLPRVSPETVTDHEARIRTVEKNPTVSPRQLGAAVFGVFGVIGALAPFLDRLYS